MHLEFFVGHEAHATAMIHRKILFEITYARLCTLIERIRNKRSTLQSTLEKALTLTGLWQCQHHKGWNIGSVLEAESVVFWDAYGFSS
jgi:hypothetical protein